MVRAFDVGDRIPPDHPLRAVRAVVDSILAELPPLFSSACSDVGRLSVPSEVLLKALLLQCLYLVRSERHMVARLDADLLFRWLCGVDPTERVLPGGSTKSAESPIASGHGDAVTSPRGACVGW